MSVLFSYLKYFCTFLFFYYLIIFWLLNFILSCFFLIFYFILSFRLTNFRFRCWGSIGFASSIFRNVTNLWLWTYLFWILANCVLTLVFFWEYFLIFLNLNLLCLDNFHFKIKKFCKLFFVKLFQFCLYFYLFFEMSL